MSNLTSDQLKRIEENRKRALQIKSMKKSPTVSQSSSLSKLHPATSPNFQSINNCRNSIDASSTNALSCNLISENRFLVACKYDPKVIAIFKGIPSRKYDPATKGWMFDVSDFPKLENNLKSVGKTLPSLQNAVIVKDYNGGSVAVELNENNFTKNGVIAKCYIISQCRFEVDMPYNAACVEFFKTLSSKTYDVNTRKWSFSLADYNILYAHLRKMPNVQVEPLSSCVLNVFKNVINRTPACQRISEFDELRLDPWLVSSLMPFQRQGVEIAIKWRGRILLADDMGLGKTVQSICIASYFRERWPLLVVCPSSVRCMWKEALLKWLPSQLRNDDINVVLTGRDITSHNVLVTVISYDLLTKHQRDFTERNFQIAIVDESHFIKNFKTARARAVTATVRRSKHVMLLSGTPALSRPAELYTQVSLLRPDLFSNFHQFGLRYCAAQKNSWGWEYSGSSNMDELRLLLLETVMLRRTKDDVLSQLPPKLRRSVTIDVSDYKTTTKQKEALESAQHAVEKKGLSGVEKHGALLQYFNETAHIKLPAIKSYVLDLLEGGHKFLVFAHHKVVLDNLQAALEKKDYQYMRVDGTTPSEKRQSEVARFQEKNVCKVALLSITAANMGITLHAASLVVFAELFWNPGILVQAEDRCYRIGQRDVVNVHYLVAKGTSDDYIWQMVKKKLEVLGQAGLSGNNFDDTESHDARKPDRDQNSILQYFKTAGSSKTTPNLCLSDHEFLEVSITDEELLLAFDQESDFFDDTGTSATVSSEVFFNGKSATNSAAGAQCASSSSSSLKEQLGLDRRKRDNFNEDSYSNQCSEWKKKK